MNTTLITVPLIIFVSEHGGLIPAWLIASGKVGVVSEDF